MKWLSEAAVGALHLGLAWVAWDAQGHHPIIWYNVLKYGFAALATVHVLSLPNAPGWIVHKAVMVSLAGSLLFLKMHKADWEPIDKTVSVYIAFWGVQLIWAAARPAKAAL